MSEWSFSCSTEATQIHIMRERERKRKCVTMCVRRRERERERRHRHVQQRCKKRKSIVRPLRLPSAFQKSVCVCGCVFLLRSYRSGGRCVFSRCQVKSEGVSMYMCVSDCEMDRISKETSHFGGSLSGRKSVCSMLIVHLCCFC